MAQRRLPSVATLAAVFDDPKEARRVLGLSRLALVALPAGDRRVRECYHPPSTDDERMHVLNSLDPGLHGVEAIKVGSEYADYLNTGDTYAATLIFWRGNYRVQSWGDFVEIMERNGFKRAMSEGDF